jgi:hypothetical protein
MSKKEKAGCIALAEDFKTMITMIPKLEAFIEVHNEIAAGYQKYRKNGGAEIAGIEKHLGIKEEKSAPSKKTKETAKTTEAKVPKEARTAKETVESTVAKKTKKKLKK